MELLKKKESGTGKSSDLAILVRKTVNSFCERKGMGGHFENPKYAVDFAVDIKTLFNALGFFRGVQHDRDMYNNSSKSGPNNLQQDEMQVFQLKKRPFLEQLNNLGTSRPPHDTNNPKESQVDIQGLDDLVQFIAIHYRTNLEKSKKNIENESLVLKNCRKCLLRELEFWPKMSSLQVWI